MWHNMQPDTAGIRPILGAISSGKTPPQGRIYPQIKLPTGTHMAIELIQSPVHLMNKEFPLGTKLQGLSELLFRDLLFGSNFPKGLKHMAVSQNSFCREQLPCAGQHIPPSSSSPPTSLTLLPSQPNGTSLTLDLSFPS